MEFEAVIGLEVHAQLKTESKMFCTCSTGFGAEPNSHICPVCTGQPGTLPVANKKAVEFVVLTGIALGCRINRFSRFVRKQYFYPDLPKNYQISQFENPLCSAGSVLIDLDKGITKKVGLTRIHLEEDAGKLLHQIGSRVIQGSLIDYNRTGVPLMEIVSEPDMHSPGEAYAYLIALKDILEYIGVSECNMEEGKLRCDANISLRPRGDKRLGTKTELKNMNSFKNVRAGIAFEIRRQEDILRSGGSIVQETRLWDAQREVSESMRSKEQAHDYRYFPEPDLALIALPRSRIDALARLVPELPRVRRGRFIAAYGLTSYDAGVLTASKELADYYEQALHALPKDLRHDRGAFKCTANWISTELLGRLHAEGLVIEASPVPAVYVGKLVALITKDVISGKIAKTVFEHMFKDHVDPERYIKEHNLAQINDETALTGIVNEVIAQNTKAVKEYKNGNERAIGSLIGQVMKKTGGKANPPLVNKILKEKLHTTFS